MWETQTFPISNPNNSGQEQSRREDIKPVIVNTRGDQTCKEEHRSDGERELEQQWHESSSDNNLRDLKRQRL